jgi:hypothetical protein
MSNLCSFHFFATLFLCSNPRNQNNVEDSKSVCALATLITSNIHNILNLLNTHSSNEHISFNGCTQIIIKNPTNPLNPTNLNNSTLGLKSDCTQLTEEITRSHIYWFCSASLGPFHKELASRLAWAASKPDFAYMRVLDNVSVCVMEIARFQVIQLYPREKAGIMLISLAPSPSYLLPWASF